MLKKYNLPNLAESFSPIFFIAVSLPKVAYELINRLKNDGFFLNIGIFPAVPIKNTGVRFTITRLHTFEQIENMVKSMAKHYPVVLEEQGISRAEIYKAFKMTPPAEAEAEAKVKQLVEQSKLTIDHFPTIKKVDAEIWNKTVGLNGTCFDWNGLNVLENSFTGNDKTHENWDFDYYIIRDNDNKVVLSTFLTTSISKDDMLADENVSFEIEEIRATDPNYMTSKTLMVGSPLTEGNHLYIDRKSNNWKSALDLLLKQINIKQEEYDIATTIIRDLPNGDTELDNYMVDNGMFKMAMPDNAIISNIEWNDEAEFYQMLTKKKKGHYRRNVRANAHKYEYSIVANPTDEEIEHAYSLYLNVKNKSLAINTFTLPYKLFKEMALNESWEFLTLKLKEEFKPEHSDKAVAIGFCYKGLEEYSFLLVGIDYEYNYEHGCYRQILAKVVQRTRHLGFKNVTLGFTSIMEKRHFGAKVSETCAYMQVKDNYSLEALGAMSTRKTMKNGANKRRALSL